MPGKNVKPYNTKQGQSYKDARRIKTGQRMDYASGIADKKAHTSEFLDPNNVSPVGNRSVSEWSSERSAAYSKAANDFDASAKYDWAINKVTKPSKGAHFRSIQNSYSTTSSHERKNK
jgi:hypothetical protein